MDTLASLDRDVSGEVKFCQQAAEALRAFQARWTSDLAVEDGYGTAIQALDNMRSILDGAQTRWTQEVTRQVLGRQEAARRQEYAKVEREHAVEWAEKPPPVPPEPPRSRQPEDATPAPVPPLDRSPGQAEAGVVA